MIEKTLIDEPPLLFGIYTNNHVHFQYVFGVTKKETLSKSKMAGFELDSPDFVLFDENEFTHFSQTHKMVKISVKSSYYHPPHQTIIRDGGTTVTQPELAYDVDEEAEKIIEKKDNTIKKVDGLLRKMGKSMSVKSPIYHGRNK